MLNKTWRLAHFALAVVSSVFLLIASITGVILAVHAIHQRQLPAYEQSKAAHLTLAEAIPAIKNAHPEISAIAIDKYGHVFIETTDENFEEQKLLIDPTDGRVIAKARTESAFIKWTISLHRSLFLHNTGRFIVGLVSFLLMLIIISGVALIIKRQRGVRKFFAKQPKGNWAVRLHVTLARFLIIPLFITALTGTYLFMKRFGLIPHKPEQNITHNYKMNNATIALENFDIFKNTKFSDFQKLEFPFFEDESEYYTLKLNDKEMKINQFNGQVVETLPYPYHAMLSNVSLDLHTGTKSSLWATILALASTAIAAFSWTGFVISYKRLKGKSNNRHSSDEAEIIILVGTENGSTAKYASAIFEQLSILGKKVYIDDMNKYKTYASAKHLIIFSCTYGDGEPPASADNFKKRFKKYTQNDEIQFSVVGFGSSSYSDYCSFAIKADKMLRKQKWATQLLPLHTVNKRSSADFVAWAKAWSTATSLELSTDAERYKFKKK